TTRHEPFYLTYGREAIFPIELQIPTYPTEISSGEQKEELLLKRVYELIGNLPDKRVEAGENISRTQEKQKKQYDQKVVETKFYIGNKVLLYKNSAKKLEEKWEGPFYIHDIGLNGTYQLRNQEGKVRKRFVHANRKDGEEQILEETSLKPPTEIDEYLDEFRIIRTDEKVLPKIDGDEDNQLTTILEENSSKCQHNYNKSGKIVRMAKGTVILFNTIRLSYLPPQRLRLSTLREMTDGNFERLMIGIRAIVAEWLQASLLWDDILNDLTFPVSQELNAGAE
ncbi:9465_t:CDS:2, partial [Entrophospora sp. SA101]